MSNETNETEITRDESGSSKKWPLYTDSDASPYIGMLDRVLHNLFDLSKKSMDDVDYDALRADIGKEQIIVRATGQADRYVDAVACLKYTRYRGWRFLPLWLRRMFGKSEHVSTRSINGTTRINIEAIANLQTAGVFAQYEHSEVPTRNEAVIFPALYILKARCWSSARSLQVDQAMADALLSDTSTAPGLRIVLEKPIRDNRITKVTTSAEEYIKHVYTKRGAELESTGYAFVQFKQGMYIHFTAYQSRCLAEACRTASRSRYMSQIRALGIAVARHAAYKAKVDMLLALCADNMDAHGNLPEEHATLPVQLAEARLRLVKHERDNSRALQDAGILEQSR